MEFAGKADRGSAVAPARLLLGRHVRLDPALMVGREASRQILDHEPLQGATHREDVLAVLQTRLRHAGAPVRPQLDEAFAVQPQERFPDEGAADAEAFADGILGQLRARRQGLLDDRTLERPIDGSRPGHGGTQLLHVRPPRIIVVHSIVPVAGDPNGLRRPLRR